VTEVRVASLAEIPAGGLKRVEVGGVAIALARVGDTVHAINDLCAHRGGPLSDGKLSGTRLACPLHGWMYDVRTGECTFPRNGARVASYPVRVEGDDVWIDVS
jgi:3-phenylpropionate/trans-cinnamate dioxygenase ferredoxin component